MMSVSEAYKVDLNESPTIKVHVEYIMPGRTQSYNMDCVIREIDIENVEAAEGRLDWGSVVNTMLDKLREESEADKDREPSE